MDPVVAILGSITYNRKVGNCCLRVEKKLKNLLLKQDEKH